MNDGSTQNYKDIELNRNTSRLKFHAEPERKIIRVLIAEDQYTIQQIWQSYLEPIPDIEIVGIAINGQAAIELVQQFKPDVVLMDINMPKINGLKATEIIVNQDTETKILIVSFSACDQDIQESLRVGATGYLLKSTDPQELVTAIRNIDRGYYQLGPGLVKKLNFNSSSTIKPEFDRTHQDPNSTNVPESKVLPLQKVQTDIISSNSVATTKRKSQGKITPSLRLFLLLFSGFLVFLLTPAGRNWRSKLPIFSVRQTEPTVTQNSSSITILPVETIQVESVDSYQVNRTYTGTVVSRRSSSLGFERAGKLLKLMVDRGEKVEVGTPLAVLDTKKLKAQQQELFAERKQVEARRQELLAGSRKETVNAARATVTGLQSQLKLAQTKSQRRQKLHLSGAISREQFDEAITEVDLIQADLNKAQSKLDELVIGTRPEKIAAQQALLEQLDAKLNGLELELEQSILKAPFTGVVANRLVDEGMVLSSGESILTLVENRVLEVHVGVPADTATQIPLGSSQKLQIGSKIYRAKVLSTLPQLNSVTRTLTVIFSLDESAMTEVLARQIARLQLHETIAESGYWLPVNALAKGSRGLWYCYVLGKSEKTTNDSQKIFRIKQRNVEVLHTESEKVFVRGTLQDSEQVVINGNNRLVTGQLVKTIKSE